MKKQEKKEKPKLEEGPSEKGFYVGLYLEHLEEASFLYEQRLGLFDDPEIDWMEIESFEERFEAHIDALVVGEALALDVCRVQAGEGDFGELHAAVRVFCRQGKKEYLLEILDELDFDDLEKVRAVTDALKYELPESFRDMIEEMIASGDPHQIGIASAVAGYRRLPLGEILCDCLKKNGTEPLPEVIWALGRLGEKNALNLLLNLLDHEDEEVAFEAALALLRSGNPEIVQTLLWKAERNAWPSILIGIAGAREMAQTLHQIIQKQKADKEALLALGFLGEVSSVEILINHLTQNEVSQTAAMALNLILAADLYEEVFIPEVVDEDILFDEERERLKEGLPLNESGETPGTKVRKLSENSDLWQKWWNENHKRFDSKIAYRNGKPFTPASVLETVMGEKTPHQVRKLAIEEFVIKSGKDLRIEVDTFISVQKKALMGA